MVVFYNQDDSVETEIELSIAQYSTAQPWKHETALANSVLWDQLLALVRIKDVDRIGVSIEWPSDGRLASRKGKEKALVLWVERVPDERGEEERPILYVYPSLLPPNSLVPLPATLYIHSPIDLSLVILQPVYDTIEDEQQKPSSSTSLSSLSSSLCRNQDEASIMRQGAVIFLEDLDRRFKILMSEPVNQGLMTLQTSIILSATPFYAHEDSLFSFKGEGLQDILCGSSHGKTHLSLTDFDPDSFLSAALSLEFKGEDVLDDEDVVNDYNGSTISDATSGSVTPRPGGVRPESPPAPIEQVLQNSVEERGVRFDLLPALGPGVGEENEDVCWLSVGGLGRAGIFEGDWVILKPAEEHGGRLVKALAWERLDEPDTDLPLNPILLPPTLYRSLVPSSHPTQLVILPTPFGARSPTLPTASSITLSRLATAEAVDKRYERSWLQGQLQMFRSKNEGKKKEKNIKKVIQRDDIFAVPAWLDKPLSDEERQDTAYENSNIDFKMECPSSFLSERKPRSTALIYFKITSVTCDTLLPIEEDFHSSLTAKARAGELGCWIDEGTKVVWEGLTQGRVDRRMIDRGWFGLEPTPPPFSKIAFSKLKDLLNSTLHYASITSAMQLSILLEGACGSGKRSLVQNVADEIGFSVVNVECWDIVGDTEAMTSGTLLARLAKAISCSPSILILHHIEALANKSDNSLSRPPLIVKTVQEILRDAKKGSSEGGWPIIVLGTTSDADNIPIDLQGCFKQHIELKAPNEEERLAIIQHAVGQYNVAPDVDLRQMARQTAALNAGDITALVYQAWDIALSRTSHSSSCPLINLQHAGLSITSQDFDSALNQARTAYSDSIGAPKIPNVSWDDVGGLVRVKKDILDTIQLPLDRPEMFGEGLKKRSGILLYGPPGTGKTLLAKAVATSCSLNFFSVKGPELLNMYIGESEANVRRVFQRARDAAPCVIFMDELDSVAPQRGNQGDSGGVMDRIVSQLLAELDGMNGGEATGVFVMGATNRPDLLDPALLRPGRFDKMLYLSIPTTHSAQASILQALTRRFNLSPDLNLEEVAEMCPFNYTGADLYALCADAMLNAMTRQAHHVDNVISRLSSLAATHPESKTWPGELTSQYYLAKMAQEEETDVIVGKEDFVSALEKLVPSVSVDELRHYEKVRREFQGFSIETKSQDEQAMLEKIGKKKGKGKARLNEVQVDGDRVS
nr:hypothetical protein L203_00260 [Cryptococcus depauperatus CBS 7841]